MKRKCRPAGLTLSETPSFAKFRVYIYFYYIFCQENEKKSFSLYQKEKRQTKTTGNLLSKMDQTSSI